MFIHFPITPEFRINTLSLSTKSSLLYKKWKQQYTSMALGNQQAKCVLLSYSTGKGSTLHANHAEWQVTPKIFFASTKDSDEPFVLPFKMGNEIDDGLTNNVVYCKRKFSFNKIVGEFKNGTQSVEFKNRTWTWFSHQSKKVCVTILKATAVLSSAWVAHGHTMTQGVQITLNYFLTMRL